MRICFDGSQHLLSGEESASQGVMFVSKNYQ